MAFMSSISRMSGEQMYDALVEYVVVSELMEAGDLRHKDMLTQSLVSEQHWPPIVSCKVGDGMNIF